jgi:hypothetical protein
MKKLLFSILGLSLLLGSCSQEVQTGLWPNSKGDAGLHIEVAGPTNGNGASTRAEVASVEGENTITSLYLLFFDQSTDGSGNYITYTSVPMPTDNDAGTMGMNIDTAFTFPAGTSAAGAYSVLAMGNLFDGIYVDGTVETWMEQWDGKSQKEVMAGAKATLPANLISSGGLLMQGRADKPAGDDQIHMVISRVVSRLDVTNAASSEYTLVTASVWNAYTTASVWGEGLMNYSDGVERLRRHYQIGAAADGNIRGGLYAFENQVAEPAANDEFTTCLIIGLEPVGGGDVEYFRANIHDDAGMQNLVRNYNYNLVIEGVDGPGAPTEEIAYLGESNKLIYYIGEWMEDSNGLVVSDDFSTLSVPTKTVNMGRDAAIAEFKIHTFSTLASPAPLTIRSQSWRPAANNAGNPPFTASLDGNTLVIESTDLDLDETERNGVIVLSYAGLEISLRVSQSGVHDDFLIVTEPDGGLLPFPAYGGMTSGLINVQASGNWTARLYMDGFSFSPQLSLDPVKMIWTNPDLTGEAFDDGRGANTTLGFITPDEEDSTIDKFRVTTHTANMGNSVRQAYIIVELDGKAEDYSAVVMLTQNYVKSLNYVPGTPTADPTKEDQWMTSGGVTTFDVDGNLDTSLITTNVSQWFVVSAQDESNNQYLPWSAVLVADGMTDDRAHFEIVRESASATNYDPNDPYKNYVTVRATGMNVSGRDYTATLRVQLTSDPGTFSDIKLVQTSFEWDAPADVEGLAGEGATTAELKIDIPAEVTGLHYTVAIQSFSPSTSYGNGAGQQFAYLIDGDDASATPTPYLSLQPNETSVGFKVGFPTMPMSFIDNEIEPEVTVAVTLVETGETKTFTVSQEVMDPRPVRVLDVGDWRHGNLVYAGNINSTTWDFGTNNFDATYQENLADFLENDAYFGPSGTVKTNGLIGTGGWRDGTTTWTALSKEVTFINYANPAYLYTYDGLPTADNTILDWLKSDSGFTLINAEGTADEERLDYSTYILGKLGLQGGGGFHNVGSVSDWDDTQGFIINPDDENPIIDYLVHSGPFGEVENWENLRIGNSGTNGYSVISSIEPALGEDAVAVLQMLSDDGDHEGQMITELVIDPSYNLMIKNDSELFYDSNTYMDGPAWEEVARRTFLLNLTAFMINSAQYGSVFTNQFWDAPNDVKTMPAAQPAE